MSEITSRKEGEYMHAPICEGKRSPMGAAIIERMRHVTDFKATLAFFRLCGGGALIFLRLTSTT